MPAPENRTSNLPIERWLREEVAPVCEAMAADPSRGLEADEVFAPIRARHADRLKGA